MSIITKITQQKRDRERYNIYVNEEYAFSVHESIIVSFQLKKGMELDEWMISEMEYADQIEKAYQRALRFLSYRMRSEYEIKQKLLSLDFGEAVILEAIVKLKKQGLINDTAFAKAVVQNQKKQFKKGPKAIQVKLQQKGIHNETQQQVIATYSQEEQRMIAQKAVRKILEDRSLTPLQQKQKIQQTLMRKGFSTDVVLNVVENVEIERESGEWEAMSVSVGDKAWRRYHTKYDGYTLRMKVKQAMYQKGIPFEWIDRYLQTKELDDCGE